MNEPNISYEFGVFRLIPSERQLLRDDQAVKLPPKAFQALVILVQNHGHAVTKRELIDKLWPDAFVEESNLNHYISLVRKALSEGSNGSRFIDTLPKFGYRFSGNVRESNGQLKSVLIHRQTRTHVVFKEEQSESVKTVSRQMPVAGAPSVTKKFAIGAAALVVVTAAFGAYFGYLRPAQSRGANSTTNVNPSNNANHISSVPAARDAYWQGRYFYNKRMTNEIRLGEQYFQKAISLDANFALAYVGLADCFLIDDPMKAEPTLRKALDMDKTLGEAHASLGFLRMFYHWDWPGAQSEFEQAVTLSPNYATARQWYALYLASQGRLNEAKQAMTRAVELEPQSPNLHADLGQILYFGHEYPDALAECSKALELDPNFIFARNYRYFIYAQKDMYAAAIEEHLLAERSSSRLSDEGINSERQAFAKTGWKAFLRAELRLHRGQDSHTHAAILYAMLEETQSALDELQLAFDAKEFHLTFVKVDPVFDSLRSHAAFQTLLRRMNLN